MFKRTDDKILRVFVLVIMVFPMSGLMADDLTDSWIDSRIAPLDTAGISLSFLYVLQYNFESDTLSGRLIIAQDRKMYRYDLGPKSTVLTNDAIIITDGRTATTIVRDRNDSSDHIWLNKFKSEYLKKVIFSQQDPGRYAAVLPDSPDTLTVFFSWADTSLQRVEWKTEFSRIILHQIFIHETPVDEMDFNPDTTGTMILDMRTQK